MNKAILRLALTAPGAKAYAAALGLVRGSFLMIRGVPTERALAGAAAGRQATKADGRARARRRARMCPRGADEDDVPATLSERECTVRVGTHG